ncbi:hypothetical protein G7046_g5670 [Stylonectria norvegica]|nr:hypothetical protein G7046_g5670 [Stylonectria norvegica]
MSLCKVCDEPLVLRLDPDEVVDADTDAADDAVETVPDDLELRCGCHFHWQCLLDQSTDVALSLKCPSCSTYLPVNEPGPSTTNSFLSNPQRATVLVRYVNEGGIQEDLDILPSITEEAYLETHPETRPARAFHVMCVEGDVGGIAELLHDAHNEGADLTSVILYQDPLAESKSGLELALENSQEEVVWLLLWLSSTLPSEEFPDQVHQAAQSLNVSRLHTTAEGDIRALKNAQGRIAVDVRERSPQMRIVLKGNKLTVAQLPSSSPTSTETARCASHPITSISLAKRKAFTLASTWIQACVRSLATHSSRYNIRPAGQSSRAAWSRTFVMTMAPGTADKKTEKSYLSSAVDSINPWANSRSTTPSQGTKNAKTPPQVPPINPEDHLTTHLYGQSFKTYPLDCPPLKVQWFHAVDAPKRKPNLGGPKSPPVQPAPPLPEPKKFSAFSVSDSRAIENEYQKLLEATEDTRDHDHGDVHSSKRKRKAEGSSFADDPSERTAHVPVNEDFLFDVDIKERELGPVYWLGPVYTVRRGTWFYQDGSNLRSCEENLAAQLEEGYLKMKPWLFPVRNRSQSGTMKSVTPKDSHENLRGTFASSSGQAIAAANLKPAPSSTSSQAQAQAQTQRLFGTYMNSVVTYQDANTAWLSSDSMLSWVTSSVYERFSGGGYMSGIKVVRGYPDPTKSKEKEKEKEKDKEKDEKDVETTQDPLGLDERQKKLLKRRSAPPTTNASRDRRPQEDSPATTEIEPRETKIQRQLSSLIDSEGKTKAETEEEIRRREEQEIQDDYNAQAGETQGREIEHLVLVTHGIGQLLSLRMESINFVHDVNVLRKTIKSVYANSADLKALNSETSIPASEPGNCRVQVLPVCWRHLLDFPKKQEKKGEHDLGEVEGDEDDYPSLQDITIEGMAFARSLISDLALDVLLYQSSYREEISRIVLEECNRIFKLFKERNPEFKGQIHIVGHSLGSAILFDILCRQKERGKADDLNVRPRAWSSQDRSETPKRHQGLDFDFEVGDFFCLGSPVGLFQMLKGRTIAARHSAEAIPSENPLNADHLDDPFIAAPHASDMEQVSPVTGLPFSVSSPKVGQLFNIFHPSDPISYRLEPLISPAMSKLKPQQLPYTKKGIFGNVAPQGLTGIGSKVGQSVSGLWSSLSAGIATNILNRSLGLTSEEVARMTANASAGEQQAAGAGTNISAGGVISDASNVMEARKKQLAETTTRDGQVGLSRENPILIDEELETLYSSFQQKRAELSNEDGAQVTKDVERKARKTRAEEAKVRALNSNGRVDYSIQEGVLDFNPINTIASHMGYWADEDVNHFVLSQLLSKRSGGK